MKTVEAATVLGRGVLSDGTRFSLVDSASAPDGAPHHVREVGPDGRYVCDCIAASYGRRCRHVNAVIAEEMAKPTRREAQAAQQQAQSARAAAMQQRYQELSAFDERQVP